MKKALLSAILCCISCCMLIAQSSTERTTIVAIAKNMVTIAGKPGGEITPAELIKAGELICMDAAGNVVPIQSFTFTLVGRGLDPIELVNNENGTLTETMKRCLTMKGEPGRKVYFEYILIGTSGREQKHQALAFILR
jgi:hypothetical protein